MSSPDFSRMPPHAPAVLFVDPPHVELGWMRRGEFHYQTVEAGGAGNEALVEAARQLVDDASLRSKGVVLCLAAPLFETRQFLLGNMPDAETKAVLARKAANAIGADLDTALYWAQRCYPPLEEAGATQSTWIVHVRSRPEHFDLLLRLRNAGIQVKRTVAERSILTQSHDRQERRGGRIHVTTTGQAVYAHLTRDGHLVQESRLPLVSFEHRAESYASVVQDVRQLAAFWTKGSRGESLQAVTLFGFTEDEVESLRVPMEIAAQGATVRALGHAPEPEFAAVRGQLTKLVMSAGTSSADLSLPLPLRRSRIVAAAVVLSLVAAVASRHLGEHWSQQIHQRRTHIDSFLSHAQTLEDDATTWEGYSQARARLTESITSLDSLRSRGIPLEKVLASVVPTLTQGVVLRQLTLDETATGIRFVMQASLSDPAESAARKLERLRRRVLEDGRFADVSVEPESRVPQNGSREELTFTLACSLVGVTR